MLVRFFLALVAVLALIWASLRIANRSESARFPPAAVVESSLYV